MLLEMAPYDRQTVTKLVASASDIGFARDAAEHLLKKEVGIIECLGAGARSTFINRLM